jgi:hypothetical protein
VLTLSRRSMRGGSGELRQWQWQLGLAVQLELAAQRAERSERLALPLGGAAHHAQPPQRRVDHRRHCLVRHAHCLQPLGEHDAEANQVEATFRVNHHGGDGMAAVLSRKDAPPRSTP